MKATGVPQGTPGRGDAPSSPTPGKAPASGHQDPAAPKDAKEAQRAGATPQNGKQLSKGQQLANEAGRTATREGIRTGMNSITGGAWEGMKDLPGVKQAREKLESLGGRVAVVAYTGIIAAVIFALLAVTGLVGSSLLSVLDGSGRRTTAAPPPTAQQCASMPEGWCELLWGYTKNHQYGVAPVPWSILAAMASRTDFGRGAAVDGIDRAAGTRPAPAAESTATPVAALGPVPETRSGSPDKFATGDVSTPGTAPTALLVGDSLAVGVAPYLRAMTSLNWRTGSTQKGKSTAWGMEQVRQRSSAGTLPDIIAVDLGTNPSASVAAFAADAEKLLKAAAGRRVFWMTHHIVGSSKTTGPKTAQEYDAALRGLTTRYPNLTLVDTAAQVAAHPEWLEGDGIHLRGNPGSQERARLIEAAILAGGQATTRIPETTLTDPELERMLDSAGEYGDCPVLTPNPPIATNLGEQGPFLLSKESSAKLTARGDDPQNPCDAARYIVQTLAPVANRAAGQFPDRNLGADQWKDFWADVLSASGVIADPAAAFTRTCLGAPAALDVGQQIEWTFACVAAQDDLTPVTVTSIVGTDVATTSGSASVRLLAKEASAVAWNWSKWGASGCSNSAPRAGLFPLTKSQAARGGARDRCDPGQSMRAVARLVLAGESVPVEDRLASTGQMLGGWAAIPYVLGKTTEMRKFVTSGPAATWAPKGICRTKVDDWATAATSAWDAGLAEQRSALEAADQALSVAEKDTDETTAAYSGPTRVDVLAGVSQQVDASHPLPYRDCGIDRATLTAWLSRALADSGEGFVDTPGSRAMRAWLDEQASSAPRATPGTDSLVPRLSRVSRSLDRMPVAVGEASTQALDDIVRDIVNWAATFAGTPVEGIWVAVEDSCSAEILLDTAETPLGTGLTATGRGSLPNPEIAEELEAHQRSNAAVIYAQAMGLGLGRNAALIAMFVTAGEANLVNAWWSGDSSESRGMFQQKPAWVPRPYKAWSGLRYSVAAATAEGDAKAFTKHDAFKGAAWAKNDARMYPALSANMFFTGPAYNRKKGLEDNALFHQHRTGPIPMDTMMEIAYQVQAFGVPYTRAKQSLATAQKYLGMIESGLIDVPEFVDDPATSGRGKGGLLNTPDTDTAGAAAITGDLSAGCGSSAGEFGFGAGIAVVAAPGSTPLKGRDQVLPQYGFTMTSSQGRPMTYYTQADPRWGQTKGIFSGGNMERCGCGPTSFAMVASTLTGQPVTPLETGMLQRDLGGFNACGTGAWKFDQMAEKYGLKMKVLGSNFSEAIRILRAGGLVMASVNPGHFTSGQHYIVIRGVTADGKLLVANSLGSRMPEHLQRAYSPSLSDFPFNRGMIGFWKA